ncbi:MAG: hypothetical protein GX949_04650 [Peptococcaceae bacterium]|jgi:hypothetical protein|nr:hypothetical protein [Peptococcaceae bacterium]
MSEVSSEVLEALKSAAGDGKISCTAARKLAADLKVPVGVVGAAADQLKIKIIACELGCF